MVAGGKRAAGAEQPRRAVAQFPPPGGTPNPYHELLYAQLGEYGVPRSPFPGFTVRALWRQRRTVRFLHFHWCVDRIYAPCLKRRTSASFWRSVLGVIQLGRFAIRLVCARLLGYELLWTVHEVRPTRRSALVRGIDLAGQRLLARLSRVVLAHHDIVADRLRAELRRPVAVEIVPHGTFRGAYPPARPPEDVRAELGIPSSSFVFLCLGHLRPDKGLGLLLDAFGQIDSDDVALIVAGIPGDKTACTRLEETARSDTRIRAILKEVPPQQVADLFAVADAFVLARSEAAWTSGSLILALSFGVPAVAARVRPVAELLGEETGGWLFTPGDAGSLALAMRRAAADRADAVARRDAARELGDRLPRWEEVGWRTAQLLA